MRKSHTRELPTHVSRPIRRRAGLRLWIPVAFLLPLLFLIAGDTPRAEDTSDLLPRVRFVEGPLPEFGETSAKRWVNSEPLTLEDLEGQVTLVEFWTFGCVNCVRSIEWLRHLETKYADRSFGIVGIHTPEFDFEKSVKRVAAFCEERGIEHPVMIDNEFRYWNRLNNRYWPAFYLVDREGVIRHVAIGETHVGSLPARDMEQRIDALLAENAP